jgi:hypothetical protein
LTGIELFVVEQLYGGIVMSSGWFLFMGPTFDPDVHTAYAWPAAKTSIFAVPKKLLGTLYTNHDNAARFLMAGGDTPANVHMNIAVQSYEYTEDPGRVAEWLETDGGAQ